MTYLFSSACNKLNDFNQQVDEHVYVVVVGHSLRCFVDIVATKFPSSYLFSVSNCLSSILFSLIFNITRPKMVMLTTMKH